MTERFVISSLCFLALAGCSATERAASKAEHRESPGKVRFAQKDHAIEVLIGGQPFSTFRFEEKWDKPFLYPLTTASGVVISRGYPVEPNEGETADHDWHRGLWYGHGDVNGHDFWRERGRDKTSTLVPKSPPAFGGDTLSVELAMLPPAKNSIGTIKETFTFSSGRGLRMIDATIQILADGGQALTFGDTDDGGFAFRLADAFREDSGGRTANAEGLETSERIWGKPSRWTDYSANIDGKLIGVAVFDNPNNLRHPTTWHARGYSLNSANPFATRSFTGDETKDGSYTVPAGDSLTLQYRVVIYEGLPGEFNIEELYQRYIQ